MKSYLSIFRRAGLILAVCGVILTGGCGTEPERSDMPEFKAWDNLSIRLSRTICFGPCPEYDVIIYGTGKVAFCGGNYNKSQGYHKKTISPEAVKTLYDFIKTSGYDGLNAEYKAKVTDYPTRLIVVKNDRYEKSVLEYAGEWVNAPKSVYDIQKAIDETAQTAAWIGDRDYDPGYRPDQTGRDCLMSDIRSNIPKFDPVE